MRKKSNKVVPFERNSEFFLKLGMKYGEKRNFYKALKYMEKAAEMEPFNADYQFNLAGVMAEVGEIEKSNDILKSILMNIDPTLSECYFGIGCNYFDIEDFGKAREYFEKYKFFDPDGLYADDVNDVLYYLQMYDDTEWKKKRLRSASRLIRESEKLMSKGEYEQACVKLEKVVEADPGALLPRNSLSMAYFSAGDVERAISLANSVLKLDFGDIQAHCNLALFYSQAGKEIEFNQQMKVLLDFKIGEKEELLRVLDTCVRLKEYSKMGKVVRNYLGNKKEFLEVLEKILDGWNIYGDVRHEIVSDVNSKGQRLKKRKSAKE